MSESKALTLAEVEKFFDRIKATVEQATMTADVKRAIAQLSAAGVNVSKKGALAAAAGRRGGGVRRKRRPGIPPARVHEFLKAAKGPVAIGEIARGMKETPDRVRATLLKLRASKIAKMAGSRSLAKWSLV